MERVLEATTHAHLDLPDGRELEFEIRSSTKARSLRLKISARAGLIVIVPSGLERDRILQLVASKVDWIAERLSEFDSVRHLVSEAAPVRPQAFDLPALAESWRIEYRATRSRTVGARTNQPGRIVVSGAMTTLKPVRPRYAAGWHAMPKEPCRRGCRTLRNRLGCDIRISPSRISALAGGVVPYMGASL